MQMLLQQNEQSTAVANGCWVRSDTRRTAKKAHATEKQYIGVETQRDMFRQSAMRNVKRGWEWDDNENP
jgi:hypothetical protein